MLHAWTSTLPAQPATLRFDRLTMDHGLSSNCVLAITQDAVGFLWIGTQNGLNRYDGGAFRVFRNERIDTSTLRDNRVYDLLTDRHGTLWVATLGGGLHRYESSQERFRCYRADPGTPGALNSDLLFRLYEDRDGMIWIGSRGAGLVRFDVRRGTFTAFVRDRSNPRAISNNFIECLRDLRNGTLLVGTYGRGVNLFDRSNNSFVSIQHDSLNENSLSNNRVHDAAEDADGTLWFATERGLDRYNPASGRWMHYRHDPRDPWSLSHDDVRVLHGDRNGNFWIGTWGGGLEYFDRRTGRFHHFLYNPQDPRTIPGNRITRIFEDRSGLLWIGTFDGGLCSLDPRQQSFGMHLTASFQPPAFSDRRITAVLPDRNGSIWIGTDGGGVAVYNPRTLATTVYRHDARNRGSLADDVVRCLARDSSGAIWIGTHSSLEMYDERRRCFVHHTTAPLNPRLQTDNDIRALLVDHLGQLWAGTSAGLKRFDSTFACVELYQYDPARPGSLRANTVTALCEDRRGRLWIGTEHGGVCLHVPGSSAFLGVADASTAAGQLAGKDVIALSGSRDGALWIGTADGSFLRMDVDRLHAESITLQCDGRLAFVASICEDPSGALWIGTDRGLLRLDPRTRALRAFTVHDGLQSNQCSAGALCRTADGSMVAGGIAGFNLFHPDSMLRQRPPPAMVVTGVRILHTPVSPRTSDGRLSAPFPEARHMTLYHSDNVFTIEFAALDFSHPAAQRFEYRLDGVDTCWVSCGSQRSVSFMNVAPGTYTFRLRGANSDGVWNRRGVAVAITIIPPWYMTWWFRSLSALLVLAAIAGAWLARARSIRRKAGIQRRLLESELKALRAQMNPHFLFNCLNAIQNAVLDHENERASDYLSKFARLMRLILDHSDRHSIPLDEEVTLLRLYLELEDLRYDHRFDYDIIVDPALDDDTPVPSMLIQPYVENAIRHGLIPKQGRGKVTVALRLADDTICCTIEDNGIGREKAFEMKRRTGHAHNPKGMDITRDRLDILNEHRSGRMSLLISDLYDAHGIAAGTKVEIEIPTA